MTTKKAIFDYDNIIYSVGFACEQRHVDVTSLKNGKTIQFPNKTEFWGRKKNEIGGWLETYNASLEEKGLEPRTRADYIVSDPIQSLKYGPEAILKITKQAIQNILDASGTTKYMGFIGKGESFRLARSTIRKYKGDRDKVQRPLAKQEIADYIERYHGGIVVTGLEADDWCIIEGVKSKNNIVIAVDKDALGNPVKVFNPDHPDRGIIDGDCFGQIELVQTKSGKEIKGFGRKFFYSQVGYGDDVDCYRSNSATDEEYGAVSVFNELGHAQDDREALEALVRIYKHLYPSPKEIVGWRKDTITIDWLYVLKENWDLARMYQKPDDHLDVEDVLKEYGII